MLIGVEGKFGLTTLHVTLSIDQKWVQFQEWHLGNRGHLLWDASWKGAMAL